MSFFGVWLSSFPGTGCGQDTASSLNGAGSLAEAFRPVLKPVLQSPVPSWEAVPSAAVGFSLFVFEDVAVGGLLVSCLGSGKLCKDFGTGSINNTNTGCLPLIFLKWHFTRLVHKSFTSLVKCAPAPKHSDVIVSVS